MCHVNWFANYIKVIVVEKVCLATELSAQMYTYIYESHITYKIPLYPLTKYNWN